MKRLIVVSLVVTAILVTACTGTYESRNARDILLHPEKFSKFVQEASQNGYYVHPENVAEQLLNLVRNDQKLLRKIYTLYADGKDEAFISARALEKMKANDDDYFIKVYESTTDYYIQTEAFLKIGNLTYVKQVITEQARTDTRRGSPSSAFLLIRGKEIYNTDPLFVDSLAINASDNFIRDAAIGITKNLMILDMYANLTDDVCDQSRYSPLSKSQHLAYENFLNRIAAKQRLVELSK